MPAFDLWNWTTLLVALSTLLIAALRTDDMIPDRVALLTVCCVSIAFFIGRAADGALTWPLQPALAGQLAAALVEQQVLYLVIRKTSPMQRFEHDSRPQYDE
jgi:hypothetical protein